MPAHSFCAFEGERLLGIAGFQTATGSLTGGIDGGSLYGSLGFWGGSRAGLVLSLFERHPGPGELLMDGIAVHADARGRGVGTRLLEVLCEHAASEGYRSVRLDVIETNPRARALYERRGFVATKTERFGYLRWLLGFGSSTTMVRTF